MVNLAAFLLLLATVVLESGAEVNIAFPSEILISSTGLNSFCIVKNETFIGWYKEGQSTKIPTVSNRNDVKNNIAVFVETSKGSMTCILIFPKGTPNSAGGKYTCKGGKNEASLDVQVRYSLDSLQTTQSLHVGQKGQIVLGALAYPLAKFVWKKDGVAIDFASKPRLTQEKDGSITISNVKESDNGIYDVDINWENRVVNDEKITVTVIEKPRFISTPTPNKLTGVSGFDYKFCCNHTGIPKPTLKWYKLQGANTVEIDVTNARYSVDADCMIIKALQKNDAATYKCTSTNSAGQNSATVAIEKVGEKPTVDPFAEDSLIKSVKKPLEIVCTGKGDPIPTIQWTSGGTVLGNQKVESGKSTLQFTGLRLEDTANFTCTAKNGLSYENKELSDSKYLQLNVIAKPLVNSQATPTTVYSFLGYQNRVLLRCVFDGFPDPVVEIVKNGVQFANGTSKASFTLKTTTKEQFGDYICNATNKHGSATQILKLKEAVVPGKPTKIQATKTCNSITLSWQPPLTNGGMLILHYVITSKNDITATKYPTRNVGEKKRTHKIDVVFKPKTTYVVQINARNGVGVGNPERVSVTTNEYCKPSPPTISTIGGKRTRPDLTIYGPNINVTWKVPQNNGFDENLRYRVEWRVRKELGNKKWEQSNEVQGKSYVIEGLKKGKYEIKVYALNQAGSGNPDMRVVNVDFTSGNEGTQDPPISGKRTAGLSKGAIAGIVIAILLLVLITIDLFCCFFNSCGVIFCCQRACCGGKYSSDGKTKKDVAEMQKLKNDPENV